MVTTKNIYSHINSNVKVLLDNRLKYPIFNIYPILYYRYHLIENINKTIIDLIPSRIEFLKGLKNSLLKVKYYKTDIKDQEVKGLAKIENQKDIKLFYFYNDLKSCFYDFLFNGLINNKDLNKTFDHYLNDFIIYHKDLKIASVFDIKEIEKTKQDQKYLNDFYDKDQEIDQDLNIYQDFKKGLDQEIKILWSNITKDLYDTIGNITITKDHIKRIDQEIKRIDQDIKSLWSCYNNKKPFIENNISVYDFYLLFKGYYSQKVKDYIYFYYRSIKVNKDSQTKSLYLNNDFIKSIIEKFNNKNILRPLKKLDQEIAFIKTLNKSQNQKDQEVFNKVKNFLYGYTNKFYLAIDQEIDHKIEVLSQRFLYGLISYNNIK